MTAFRTPEPATPPDTEVMSAESLAPTPTTAGRGRSARDVAAGEHTMLGDGPSVRAIQLQLMLARLSDSFVILSVLMMAFLVSNIGRMPDGLAGFLALRVTVKNVLLLVLFLVAWRVLGRLTGVYDWDVIRRGQERARVCVATGCMSLIALLFPAISVTGAFSYAAVVYFWLGSTAGILVLRGLVRSLVPSPEGGRPREALIVGTGARAQRLAKQFLAAGAARYRVVGFVDSEDRRPASADRSAYLGSLDQVEDILMRFAVDEVLITLPIKSAYGDIQSVLQACDRVGVSARYLADLFEPVNGRSSRVNESPFLIQTPAAPQGWDLVVKRIIDLVGAIGLLIILSPVLLIAALAVKLSSPGPVLFTQRRNGYNRRLFRMYKFRTMIDGAEDLQTQLEERNEATGPVFKIRQDPRVTRVGKILRRTSIDELPQLFNVLRGEMSLVGPRPLPVRDVHRFTEAALMRRFSVRPGLTCLWQIGGRSDVGFDEWIALDLKYIDEWSILLDLVILLRTVPAVLRGTGAS